MSLNQEPRRRLFLWIEWSCEDHTDSGGVEGGQHVSDELVVRERTFLSP